MKANSKADRRPSHLLVPIGAVKTHTKGSADMNLDGSQGQTRDPHGISQN